MQHPLFCLQMFAMFRAALPVIILALPASADGICRNLPYSPDNCVRALACIGDTGLFFDGQARGWDRGTITGQISDGTSCTGTWATGGLFGTGNARVTCTDGNTIGVVYHAQDDVTGTTIGRGLDSFDRVITAWTGENVLQFLTGPDAYGPALPCIPGDIPIS